MLYICSKIEKINNYWLNQFNLQGIKTITSDEIFYGFDFKPNDLLVIDTDQFNSLDETMECFNTIPKHIKVIAILDEPKLAHGTYLIKNGFKSYLGKKSGTLIVKQAVLTVLENNVWLYPELMNYIIKHISLKKDDQQSFNLLEKLTSKEAEVANLVADGLSNKEIAAKIDVQVVTVKKHISSIFNKLNVKDRVSLAIMINK